MENEICCGRKIDCENVYDAVVDFFTSRCGHISLLEIACLGNAEKTIQGELLASLRMKGFFAVSESGYRAPRGAGVGKIKDRHIDVLVFCDGGNAVAIELKHHSPHQTGQARALCEGLDHDYDKCKGGAGALPSTVALVQVGLYTEIDSISPMPPPKVASAGPFAFYRFLVSYPLKKLRKRLASPTFPTAAPCFTNWLSGAASGRYDARSSFSQGRKESFQIPVGHLGGSSACSVSGSVHYFIGLAL